MPGGTDGSNKKLQTDRKPEENDMTDQLVLPVDPASDYHMADSGEDAMEVVNLGVASISCGDALRCYEQWPRPACIISDGPYGLGKFPGEPHSPDELAQWYAPHAAAWSRQALPYATLWFWNSEIGWAKSHPALELNGWKYEETVIWDKGINHVAGNCNSKTIRGVPVVTEVAVRYTKKVFLETDGNISLPIKEWVRAEWDRSGLPLNQSNAACDVKNAATRKYLTQCHLWYFPPADAILSMAAWCTKYGRATTRPYFSLDGSNPPNAREWELMRAKWNHVHGVSNVWQEPAVHGPERIKIAGSATVAHANQKPIALLEKQIAYSTDPSDVVWEPFGGLCSATAAAIRLNRRGYAAEINQDFFKVAKKRLRDEIKQHGRMRSVA